MLRRLLITTLLLLLLPAAAQKKNKKGYGTFYRKADQRVEIVNADTTLQMAHRKCENYAWAAIVDAMMRAQDVKIPQDDWASNTSAGMKCFPSLTDYSERALAISTDYTLDA